MEAEQLTKDQKSRPSREREEKKGIWIFQDLMQITTGLGKGEKGMWLGFFFFLDFY